MTLKIIASQCTSCTACEAECPNLAISERGELLSSIQKNAPNALDISTVRNAPLFVLWTTPA